MKRSKSDDRNRRQYIKHKIAAKLALGAACLVLTATVAHKAGAAITAPTAKNSITDRIEAIRLAPAGDSGR